MHFCLFIFVFLLLFLPNNSKAQHCICNLSYVSLKGAHDKADLVIKGTAKRFSQDYFFFNDSAYIIKVNHVFKGNKKRKEIPISYDMKNSCEFSFWEGKEYLLFIDLVDGRYKVDPCGRSGLYSTFSDVEEKFKDSSLEFNFSK